MLLAQRWLNVVAPLLFAWRCYSLFDSIVHPILVQRCCSSRLCSTLLLFISLLNVVVLRSLLNVVAPSLLSQCCWSSCRYSTLLFLDSLLDTIVVVCLLNAAPRFALLDTTPLFLARHYSSLLLAWHCCFCTLCSTLLLFYPCSKLLLLNPCLTLQLLCSLFDVAIRTFLVHLQHSLFLLRYLSTTPWCCCSFAHFSLLDVAVLLLVAQCCCTCSSCFK